MRDKTITVTLGEDLYVKAPHVFQYDYGLMLVLDGVQLPADYEVHFSNKKHGVAKKAEVTENGVKIPDEYLRSGEDIYAWVYLRNGDEDGYTVYSIQFPVISRSVEQGDNITPVEHNIIDEAIEALNEAVEQTEQNVLNYPYINEDKYWMVYDAERGEFVNTGVKAQGDNRFNLDIGTVTTLPPGDEATASITWVGDDARLNLGLPAGDTSTLVSVHDERANDVTVTIHDGADNLGVDEFIIAIEPIQEGSGVPGPRNIRRISGVTGVTLTHTAGSYTETYETSFESEAGTVYSGVFNPMTGKLIIDRVLITKRCLDMDNAEVQPGWRNSGIRDIVGTGINQVFENQTLNVGTSYAVDTTGDNDLLYLDYNHYNMRQSDWKNTEITVQICVMLAEPMEYIFESYIPTVQLGDNTFTVSGGKIGYIKYPCDTKKYVEGAIDNSGYYTKPAAGIPLADLSSGVTNEISNKIDKSQRGVSGGVAELDQNGKVPSTQLPSYVDDVLEYGSIQSFPLYGETGKIYVAKNTNKTYRWGGNGYVEISESLALGETSGSAFRGDHGKIAYDHAIDPNKTTAQAEGLYKVAVTGEGHVASVTNVEKSDIIALGIKEPEDLIDDTAGAGDTHKVWSANKLSSEIGAKYTKPNDGIPASDLASGVIPSVPVQDVRVNGTSILNQGVANVPVATANVAGVVRLYSIYGVNLLASNSEYMVISKAMDSEIKAGTQAYKPIVPSNAHTATFYGLAKAAGDVTQAASSNPVGEYTEDAKLKIQEMIGTPVIDDTAGDGDTDKVWSADKMADECSNLSTAINDINDVIEEQFGEPETTVIPELTIKSGKFVGTDGNEVTISNWSCCDFVDVSDAKDNTVSVTSTIFGNYATLSWYGENKQFIGGINGTNCSQYGITESWLIKTYTIELPATAKYLRCNVFLDYSTENDLKIQYIKPGTGGDVAESLESKLNKSQGQENAGKVMAVDNTGNVVPVSSPWSDDVSSKADKNTVDVISSIVGDPEYMNLVDATKIAADTYIDGSTGVKTASSYYKSSDFLLLKANTLYYVGSFYIGQNTAYQAFYSEPKEDSFIANPDITLTRDASDHCTVLVGSDDVYVRFSALKASTNLYVSSFVDYYVAYAGPITLKEMVTPKCRFKKILVLGDSITTDYYGNYKKWVTHLIDEGFFPSDVNNNSQHATGFVARYDNQPNDFISRLTAVQNPETYDLVIVFGGVNDAIKLIPMGTDSDTDYTTYLNPAVKYFYKYLCTNFINARIGVCLPLPCSTQNRESSVIGVLYQYSEFYKKVAESYSLPVLDLTNHSGFYPDANKDNIIDYDAAQAFRNRWTLVVGQYAADGIHPTEEYEKKFLAPMIKKFIESL